MGHTLSEAQEEGKKIPDGKYMKKHNTNDSRYNLHQMMMKKLEGITHDGILLKANIFCQRVRKIVFSVEMVNKEQFELTGITANSQSPENIPLFSFKFDI